MKLFFLISLKALIALAALLCFSLIPIFSSFEVLGQYNQLFSYALGLSMFLKFGIDSYMVTLFSRNDFDEHQIKNTVGAALSFSLAATLIISFFSSFISFYLFLFSLVSFFMVMMSMISTYFKIIERPISAVIFESGLITFILISAATFYYFVKNTNDLSIIYACIVIFAIPFLLLYLHKFKLGLNLNKRSIQIIKGSYKHILSLTSYAILIGSMSWLPIILAGFNFGSSIAGEYTLAFRVSMVLALLQSSMSTFFMPYYVKSIKKSDKTKLAKLIFRNGFLGLLISATFLITLIFSLPIIASIYDQQDILSELLIIFVIAQGISLLIPSDGYILMSMKKNFELMLIHSFALIIFLIMVYLLTSQLNIAYAYLGYIFSQKIITGFIIYKNLRSD